jgi:hypothetical protein
MASLTITISGIPPSLSRDIELEWAQRAAALAIQQARMAGGQVTSGTINDPGAPGLATWSYTPTGVPTDEPKIAPAGAPLRFIDEVAMRWRANECLHWPFHRKALKPAPLLEARNQ